MGQLSYSSMSINRNLHLPFFPHMLLSTNSLLFMQNTFTKNVLDSLFIYLFFSGKTLGVKFSPQKTFTSLLGKEIPLQTWVHRLSTAYISNITHTDNVYSERISWICMLFISLPEKESSSIAVFPKVGCKHHKRSEPEQEIEYLPSRNWNLNLIKMETKILITPLMKYRSLWHS